MFSVPAHKAASAAQIVNPLPLGYGEPAKPAVTKPDVKALPLYRVTIIREVPIGEYVRRLNANGMQAKTYRRGRYDRVSGAYELHDCDDLNRSIWLRGQALVAVGFTY